MSAIAVLARPLAGVWRDDGDDLGIAVLAVSPEQVLVIDRTGAMAWAPIDEVDVVDTSLQLLADEGARAQRVGDAR